MCKEMPVILVNRVVDKKRIIGKNGGPRRRCTKKYVAIYWCGISGQGGAITDSNVRIFAGFVVS
jgi:hypothetical protein